MKTHYVYKITNNNPTDSRKYYIGVRTCEDKSPEEDNYWSSSKYLKEAIYENGKENFSKEILSVWQTRKEANAEEIRLHELYDVAKNDEFYNRSIQTSDGFCVNGFISVIDTRDNSTKQVTKDNFDNSDYFKAIISGLVNVFDIEKNKYVQLPKEEYHKNKSKYKYSSSDRVTVIDTRNSTSKQVSKKDFEKFEYYVSYTKCFVSVIDTRDNVRKIVTREEFENNENLIDVKFGKVSVFDTFENIKKIVSVEEYRNSNHLIHFSKGKITAKDIRNNTYKRITKDEFDNCDYYVGGTTGTVTVLDTRDNTVKQVKKNDFDKFDYYESIIKGKVNVFDTRDNTTKQVTKEEFEKWEYYVHPSKGKVSVIDTRDNTTKQVTKENYEKYEHYQFISCGTVNVLDVRDGKTKRVSKTEFNKFDHYVSSNVNKIAVYKSDGTLFGISYGNFSEFCKTHNLAYTLLVKSYKNNKLPIFINLSEYGLKRLKSSSQEFQIGWYAEKLKK